MQIAYSICVIVASVALGFVNAQNAQCPIGQYTKAKPSAESGMKACKQYACNSCCTANLTVELAKVPLQVAGGMNYDQCGGLSSICSQYMSYVQCFYQCSPNLYPWLGQAGRLYDLPLCASFCDEWFHACSNDQTCVKGTDWTRGYVAEPDPNNPGKMVFQCETGAPCRNFTEVYHDSAHFCTEMWPGMVTYQEDESKCMNPAGEPADNAAVVRSVDGASAPFTICEEVTYIDTGAIIGIVIGCLAGLALICGAIVFFLRNKQQKPAKKEMSKTPKIEQIENREMENLNPEPLE